MDYPFKCSTKLKLRRSIVARAGSWLESRKVFRRRARKVEKVEITPLRRVSPTRSSEIAAICLSRNDINILPEFLKHYRRLGVTRFIFLDDASTDGTKEFLLSEEDVDVWTSSVRYIDAKRGKLWREALFNHYGLNRWYLNLDSDEFLFYDDCVRHSLFDVIEVLNELGVKRLPAPMIDMYPSNEGEFADGHPWMFSNLFDTNGYDVTLTKRAISIEGGPRRRIFGEKNELMKYPLIYWDEACSLGVSIHQPLPYARNFSPLWGALLHFKFFGDYRKKIETAVMDGQHFNGSAHYRNIAEVLRTNGKIDFMCDRTAIFQGPEQLRELGLISPIPYEEWLISPQATHEEGSGSLVRGVAQLHATPAAPTYVPLTGS
jgi:hypothetical protein